MRLLKILGITVITLLAILVVIVVTIRVVPGNYYKDLISAAVKSSTGRELTIGDLDVRLGSRVGFIATDVSLSNAPWGSRPQMFTGRLVAAELALRPLLSRVLDLRLVLKVPDLLLETDSDGQGNWQLPGLSDRVAGDEGGAGRDRMGLRPLIREVRLENASVGFIDAQSGRRHQASIDNLVLGAQGERIGLTLKGQVDDHPLTLDGGIDDAVVAAPGTPANFDLTGGLGEVALNARGTVDAGSDTAQVDLRLDLTAPTLAALSTFAGRSLPDQGPLQASLRVSGAGGRYSAGDIKLDLDADLLELTLAGAVADLAAVRGVDLDVSAKTDRLPDLVGAFGVAVPVELPPSVEARGKIRGGLEALALADLHVDLKDDGVKASMVGQVDDAIALTGVRADVDIQTDRLSRLSRYAGTTLPDAGPLGLRGRLASPQGLGKPSDVSAALSADGVTGRIDGRIENLLAATGIALGVELEGDSLQQVAHLAGQQLANREPLRVKTQFSVADQRYRADDLQIALGDTTVNGALAFAPAAQDGGRPRLEGRIHLGTLKLPEPDATGTAAAQAPAKPQAAPAVGTDPEATPAEPPADGKRVFSSKPLPVVVPRDFDVDLAITADGIGTPHLMLEQVDARLSLHAGVLKLAPVTAVAGSGGLKASGVLDTSGSPPTLAVDVDLKDGTSRKFDGRYSLHVDLDGHGDSIARIMAGLDGQVILDLRDFKMEKSVMTRFGRGLLDTLNPFEKEAQNTELVCAIVRFDVADGIADAQDKIVAQLTKVTWFGGGTVNLKDETLDLGAQSKPRTGLGIDTLVGLPGLVHVGGTLANPRIVPDPKGVAKTYGEGYLTVVTGGAYLLVKGLWDKAQANSDVCAKILERHEDVKVGPATGESDGKVAPVTGDDAEATATQ